MDLVFGIFVWVGMWLAPLSVGLWLVYGLINLPLRRQDRARALLTLVDTVVSQGQQVESTLIAISDTRDPGLGNCFFELAAWLRKGLQLSDALQRVPGFVPPQIVAMLKAGETLGDLRKVLPGCRQLLQETLPRNRGSTNYLLVTAFFTTPIAMTILSTLQLYALPKLQNIATNTGNPDSTLRLFLTDHRGLLFLSGAILWLVVWAVAFVYIGGSMYFTWFRPGLTSYLHRLYYRLPWRRKRMQRDFSSMLAILLDSGIPEPQALTMAADCTANTIFQQRAGRAVASLKQGVKLTEAVQEMDDSGEFGWRLRNAVHANGGFLKALDGWITSLEARAFQEEQTSAQIASTGLVLLNGLFVGTIVVGIFSFIIGLINAGLQW